jgi:hypothetical protein
LSDAQFLRQMPSCQMHSCMPQIWASCTQLCVACVTAA